ncbi:glycosyltransferase [Pectinatus frisingensis]|uniref:glycosyltransferase n=1 Tax=Pectinatus frisingensis TaxID=865 RepID=UPI0018C7C4F2|nr:glycosyltransferase [Pectinatus frisingensis]
MQYAELIWDKDIIEHKRYIENLAPIILFTYARPDHTRKTIEALRKNIYAKDSNIYIYSDAPKDDSVKDKVDEVRMYLRTISGFKNIKVIERKENWGLANNIIDGVTNIVNKYGKIIVLEDDIVTSKYFLKYMNDALTVYKDVERVMAVSGYSYIEDEKNLPETYFLPVNTSWGWATWERSWAGFERNPQKLMDTYTNTQINMFNLYGAYNFWEQVILNARGELYTWAVFFYEHIFSNSGLCVYPKYNMVTNIGFDGSGENCGNNVVTKKIVCDKIIQKFSLEIKCDDMFLIKLVQSFKKNSLIERIIVRVKKLIR